MAAKNLGIRFLYDHSFIDDPIKLKSVELIQIGEICLEATYEMPRHSQCCNEISYIISGNGFFIQDGDIRPVAAGDVIVTPSKGYHYITTTENDSLTYAYCGFNINTDSEIPADIIKFFSLEKQAVIRDSAEIYGYFRKCMDEFYRAETPDRLLVETFIMQIILLTRRMASQPENAPLRPAHPEMGQLVYRIMKYIDRNISEPPTVNLIADRLGYSPYYISHAFKSKMDTTLQSYINECRINRAKELIAQGHLTLTEIHVKTGYLNPQSFSRAFKHCTGMTPTEYKLSLKKN